MFLAFSQCIIISGIFFYIIFLTTDILHRYICRCNLVQPANVMSDAGNQQLLSFFVNKTVYLFV